MRTIVESDEYREAIQDLRVDFQRLDDALHGVTTALSQRPEIFPRIEGTRLRAIRTNPFPGVPALLIWFTFSDAEVHLLAADAMDRDNGS